MVVSNPSTSVLPSVQHSNLMLWECGANWRMMIEINQEANVQTDLPIRWLRSLRVMPLHMKWKLTIFEIGYRIIFLHIRLKICHIRFLWHICACVFLKHAVFNIEELKNKQANEKQKQNKTKNKTKRVSCLVVTHFLKFSFMKPF